MRSVIATLVGCSLLAGCAGVPLRTDGQLDASEVMRRVKEELAYYYFYMHQHENDPALQNVCGGTLAFRIKSVAVTLTSVVDDTGDLNASATLPVGAVGTFGPAVDLATDQKRSSTLKYTFYPVDPGPGQPAPHMDQQWQGVPIASSIEGLREALLKASDTQPCEVFTAPDDPGPPAKKGQPADQTVTFDFTVTRTGKAGAAFKFVLFSVGAGATATHQNQAGNNIVVTFNATPKSVGLH
jgi:hypothetical protein